MKYQDHQKLENAYDQVLLKEGVEIPNMDVGQDPREGYPEKFDEEDQNVSAIDIFNQGLREFSRELETDSDNQTKYNTFVGILKKVSKAYFEEGQRRGKETWKN